MFAGFQASPLQAAAPQTTADSASQAQSIVGAINAIRSSHGLHPLVPQSQLTQAAQGHVVDMVVNHNHSHTGSDGSSVRTRIARTGYGDSYPASENWVAVMDPSKAIEWWMNSYVHRANILNPNWQEFGVGASMNQATGLYYYVVVFASRGAGYVAAPAANHVAVLPPVAPTSSVIPATYTVQQGDTLSSIATKYGMAWQSLASINGLGEFSILALGQNIRLQAQTSGQQHSTGGAITSVINELTHIPYAISPGDTLAGIAQRYGTSWQALATLNGLSEYSVLQIDQIVRIPVQSDNPIPSAPAESSLPANHTVQPGETIISIALQYQLGWKELLRMNGLGDSTILSVGQNIRLR